MGFCNEILTEKPLVVGARAKTFEADKTKKNRAGGQQKVILLIHAHGNPTESIHNAI